MISLTIGDLKPALAGLAKVVSPKSRLECLRCIRVEASAQSVRLTGTDLDMFAQVELPEAKGDSTQSFLLPLDRLQATAKRLPPTALLHLEPGKIAFDLGGGRVSENITSPDVEEFPEVPAIKTRPAPLPESFASRFSEAMGCASTDQTRYVLNGVHFDISEPRCHQLVGTDGRHLFSANSFTLPLSESLTVPNHRLLAWRGLIDLPWAMASEEKSEHTMVRLIAGRWTLTMKAIEGNYPNWRVVVPKTGAGKTTVTLPADHDFASIVRGLPEADKADKPVLLVATKGTISVGLTSGKNLVPLPGATAQGPDLRIALNRDYLLKALGYGLNRIALIDPRSPLQFSCEGRQMVVMPLRLVETEPSEQPNQPAPSEPQPNKQPMTATPGQSSGGAQRSSAPTDNAKSAVESALDMIEASKAALREAIAGLAEISALLRQSAKEQKASEKEIQQVRQTLRSLQSVRI